MLEDEAGVFDFQLGQRDARTLVLRLALKGAEGRRAMDRCRRALEAFLRRQGAGPVRWVEELGQAVARGRSGKACRIRAETRHP